MKAGVAAAGLLASILALAGCSSTSLSSKVPAAFATRMNGVCATNLAQYPIVGAFPYSNFNPDDPSASQLPTVGAYFAQNQRGTGSLESAINALGEPSTGASSWNKVKTLAFSFLSNATTQKNDALASNVNGFVAAVKQNQTITNQLKAAAMQAGISITGACATEF